MFAFACSWSGEPVDCGELVGRPHGEHDEEDEAGEVDGAASAETAVSADEDHQHVGDPHG